MKKRMPRRRGVAAVMAMLFLVLFSTLAVGFYASTNSASQIVSNEERAGRAQLAAESGMEFIRYHLASVRIPTSTPDALLFDEVWNDLQDQLDDTANVGGDEIDRADDTIFVPATGWVTLDDSGLQFRATLKKQFSVIQVTVVGRNPNESVGGEVLARGVYLEYGKAPGASKIFDYGVASKGKITTAGSSRIKGATDAKKGSVLSTCTTDPIPVSISGKEVSGDISVSNPSATVAFSGASIGGETDPALIRAEHIHVGVPEPEFPSVNTDPFKAFATNVYTGTGSTLVNCVIPANTNPKFSGGVTIKGVLYVEAPNNVEFRGGVNIKGVIVTENDAPGTLSSNVLDFSGNVHSSGGVESLTPADLPSMTPERVAELNQLKGSFILADNFHTKFSGNFHTVNGCIISSKVTMSGNAGGTIIGTIVCLDDTAMSINGSSEIVIASTGTSEYPEGVTFPGHYAPLRDTYKEFNP